MEKIIVFFLVNDLGLDEIIIIFYMVNDIINS